MTMESRRKALLEALAERFAPVRGQMTDAEFATMLARMVRTAERFAEIDARPEGHVPDMSPDEIRRGLNPDP